MEELDLPGLDTVELSEDALAQLEILEQSQGYLVLVIVSLFLSFSVMNGQKKQIICGAKAGQDDFFSCQFLSNILTLTALFFFYGLGKDSYQAEPNCQSGLNLLAGVMVLAAGLIRTGLLVCNR